MTLFPLKWTQRKCSFAPYPTAFIGINVSCALSPPSKAFGSAFFDGGDGSQLPFRNATGWAEFWQPPSYTAFSAVIGAAVVLPIGLFVAVVAVVNAVIWVRR